VWRSPRRNRSFASIAATRESYDAWRSRKKAENLARSSTTPSSS
jgi:hypothetical protein